MSDDDMEAGLDAGKVIYAMFLSFVHGGFSENQALKLVALTISTTGLGDGMPGLADWGDNDDD